MRSKIFFPFIISFALLVMVIVLNMVTAAKVRNHTHENIRSRTLIIALTSLSNNLKSAEVFSPHFMELSREKLYQLYQSDLKQIPAQLNNLKNLVYHPQAGKKRDTLERMVMQQLPALEQKSIAELLLSGEQHRLNSLFRIHQLISSMVDDENARLAHSSAVLDRNLKFFNLMMQVLSALAIAFVVYAFVMQLFSYRKQQWLEGFLASIFNTAQDGILYFQHLELDDFRIDYVNEAASRLLGKQLQLKGKKFSDLGLPLLEQRLKKEALLVLKSGIPTQFDLVLNENGSKKWLMVSLARLHNGVTANLHDISNLKKYEQELKEKIIALERSNAELEQYAFAASHDLQEPLRKILTFGSYLQDTQAYKLDEQGQQQLSKMLKAADRMSVVIKDLLSFSALKKEMKFVPTDLNQILENVLSDLEMITIQKNASIQAAQLPVISAIPLQMHQLFYNLLNNALKFSRAHVPLTINISSRLLLKEEREQLPALHPSLNYYLITVEDNGIGFDPVYSEKIFELFKRLHDKASYGGSGIGLALCKKVVENHHGFIKAEGREGEGSTFFIYLSQNQPAEQAAA